MLQIGDKMPAFSVADEHCRVVTEKDLLGKKTVIYFYPKDSTPGCTAEACNIRDNHNAFIARGYQVFGVSKDSQASHVKFKEKYGLPFPLLSDPTTQMGHQKPLRPNLVNIPFPSKKRSNICIFQKKVVPLQRKGLLTQMTHPNLYICGII